MTDSETTPPVDRPRYQSSKYWLVAALVVSLIGIAFVGSDFIGLLRIPAAERLTDAAPVDTSGSLTVAVARTPGGPEEWANWGRVIKHISDDTLKKSQKEALLGTGLRLRIKELISCSNPTLLG